MKKIVFIISGIFISLGAIILASGRSGEEEQPVPKLENPRIVVKKRERVLHLYDGERLVKTYKIALGFAPEGDKQREGDGKTPEGEFYLSLGLSYPSIADAKRGWQSKLITRAQHDAIVRAINERRMPPQNTRLGGEIYLHGGGGARDWTWGCVAVEDAEIREIFDSVSVGTRVRIEP